MKRIQIKKNTALIVLLLLSVKISGQVHFDLVHTGDLSLNLSSRDWYYDFDRLGTWIDYDGDGDLDFIGKDYFFVNDGFGTFDADTVIAPGYPPTVVDLNNDGMIDLISTGRERDTYIHFGNGNGFDLFVLQDSYSFSDASCIDINNDGFVDILLVDSEDFNEKELFVNNKLYVNNGGKSFTMVEGYFGIREESSWADYDQDGDMDFITGGHLYENTGDQLAFRRVDQAGDSIGGRSWGDYNNDGFDDLFCVRDSAMLIYVNNQDGSFSKDTIESFVKSPPHHVIGSSWGDLDNDGDLDLVVINFSGPTTVYLNEGGILVATEDVINDPYSLSNRTLGPAFYTGVVFGDYDNDGSVDIYVGGAPYDGNRILLNSSNTNSWINISLRGTDSNYFGIGAKVYATAVIDGEIVTQYRQVRTRHGRYSGNLNVHYGLGDAEKVDRLRIEWPSGKITEIKSIAANQHLIISEDMEVLSTALKSNMPTIFPNPVAENFTIRSEQDYLGEVSIRILSLDGKVLHKEMVRKEQLIFDHSVNSQALPKGIYLLQMQFGDITQTLRLIKE